MWDTTLGGRSMFKSIRWRFITIYFILVFIAMAIIGAYIIERFEDYHLKVVTNDLNSVAQNHILPYIEKIPSENSLQSSWSDIQEKIDNSWKLSFYREDIFIIDEDFKIVASSHNSFIGESAISELEDRIIVEGMKGNIIEKDKKEGLYPTKNIVFPIIRNGKVEGLLYLRHNLKEIYDTLDSSKWILTQATLIALVITVILGYLIAKSITEPINDVTEKAALMAKGNFDQIVEVQSNDEIGKLGEMFNYLTQKLKVTLGEISSEKSKMEAILNYMADGLIAINLEGKIIHANPKAISMLDFSEEDILEKNYDELIGPLNQRLTLKNISKTTDDWIGNDILSYNNSIYRVSFAPFIKDEGEKGGLVLVIQDITEQQKLEEMRREFVANVSHELKTPLTSIKSYTETLLDGIDDKEITNRFLNVINSEADRMSRLVRDLLQLSNFDYRQTKWDKKEHDLVKLIKQSIMKLEVTASNKKQNLELITDLEELKVNIDYDRIEQVLLNIISNAIKYTDEKGQVNIYLEKNHNMAKIRVQDNGIGIPQEDLPRIFERFYRVDKARSRELGGTGLGLSIAKEIIEGHGGNIQINSKPNEGTEVRIELPIS